MRALSRVLTALILSCGLALALVPTGAAAHGDRGYWSNGPGVVVPPPGSTVIVVPRPRPVPPPVYVPPVYARPYWGPEPRYRSWDGPERHHHHHWGEGRDEGWGRSGWSSGGDPGPFRHRW
ncbi:hypothetical protein [Azospirillum sp. sgz302134]